MSFHEKTEVRIRRFFNIGTSGATFASAALLLSLALILAAVTNPLWSSLANRPADAEEPPVDDPASTQANGVAFYCDEMDTVAQYTCLIEQSAAGAARFLHGHDRKTHHDFEAVQTAFKVLSALEIVSSIVSSSRYSFLKKHLGEAFLPPGADAALCLDRGYGICGNHYAVFETFLTRLDIPVRYVRMYFFNEGTGKKNSHIATEVEIDGSWRFVDISKGAIWLRDRNDLLSMIGFDDVMQGHGHLISNATLPWILARGLAGFDNFPYLTSRHVDTLIGDMHGVIRIYFEDSEGRVENTPDPNARATFYSTGLRGVPSYVSLNAAGNGRPGRHLQYRLVLPKAAYSATFAIASIERCDGARLSIGDREFDLKTVGETLSAPVTGDDIVKIVGSSERCRVSFEKIEVSRPPI